MQHLTNVNGHLAIVFQQPRRRPLNHFHRNAGGTKQLNQDSLFRRMEKVVEVRMIAVAPQRLQELEIRSELCLLKQRGMTLVEREVHAYPKVAAELEGRPGRLLRRERRRVIK